MRRRLEQFMQGRYGTDELSKFLLAVCLILLLLNTFTRMQLLYLLTLALLGYCYFRMFSRNISGLRTEDPDSKRKRKDLYYLSEVQA